MSALLRFGTLMLVAGFLQAPATEPGFTQLFNGKDFTGWKLANPDSFRVEDGAFVANAKGMQRHA